MKIYVVIEMGKNVPAALVRGAYTSDIDASAAIEQLQFDNDYQEGSILFFRETEINL